MRAILTGIALSMATITTALTTMEAHALTPNGKKITHNDFLKVEGGYLKNQSNQVVALRGVNAGGWLIQESWMCPINGDDRAWANLDTINTLKNRGFTDRQIQTLFDTYQDNWFTTIDLDNMQAMGINCVRVPFWYRNFMSDENGTWITGNDLDSNPGIKRLDWVIEECGKRGMYVILDCHGAPGGQSMDHCCGTLCKNELYDSSQNRAILKDLWTKIAERYKDNPVVAAYDILNEPQNNGGYSGANAWAPGSWDALSRTYSVYDEMYKAIRAVDPNHVITIEAIWTGDCLPNPANYGWTNLLYQMHIYDTSRDMIDTRVNELKHFQSQYGVAVYAGEFNCDPNEEYAMNKFNEAGISWTTWAYKGAKQGIGNNWFLYVKNIPYADVNVDSYETILSKWGSVLKTSNFDVNESTVKAWVMNNVNASIAGQEMVTPVEPVDVPDKLEAENYAGMSGIQTETTSDDGGGRNIGWIEAGDWAEYNVNVKESGTYTINIRVASENGSENGIQIKDGDNSLCSVSVPNTGGWQNWETISGTVKLEKGFRTLRLFAGNSNYNVNWIEFVKDSTSSQPGEQPTDGSEVILYEDINYGGSSVSLGLGEYNLSDLKKLGVSNDSLSSLKVPFGYKVTLYENENFEGATKVVAGDTSWIGSEYNDWCSSVKIEKAVYIIKNYNSGKVLDVTSWSVENGANIIQWEDSRTANQKWYFNSVGDGYYSIISVHTGKALDVCDISTENGANIQQWEYTGGANQQWRFNNLGNGLYSIINKNSNKSLDVADWSKEAGGNIQQWEYSDGANQQWYLIME